MQSEQNSVMAVFETVARCGEISRAELSQLTGFSQVTVGKAVDVLCGCGVLTEYKQSRGTVGRRSGICALASEMGMLLFDLSGDKFRVRVCDLALNVHSEYETDEKDIGTLAMAGFAHFIEAFGGELIGMGCVAVGDKLGEYADAFAEAMGHAPELMLEESRAYTAANCLRLDGVGTAVLLRLHANGGVDGGISVRGRLHSGAHGKAGGFSRAASSYEALISFLPGLCAVIDPQTVHIACEREEDCEPITEAVKGRLEALGIGNEAMPQILSEPMCQCRSALDGAALLLREQYVMLKLAKNT